MKITTRTRSPKGNLVAECTVRLPLQARQLLTKHVVVEGHDSFSTACRRDAARDLRVDVVNPTALGQVDAV